jgi:hypothetical protein
MTSFAATFDRMSRAPQRASALGCALVSAIACAMTITPMQGVVVVDASRSPGPGPR